MRYTLLALLLLSCGAPETKIAPPPSWTGSFVGELTDTYTCNGILQVPIVTPVLVATVQDTGKPEVYLVYNNCPGLEADVSNLDSTVANFLLVSCYGTETSFALEQESFIGGYMQVSETSLTFNAELDMTVFDFDTNDLYSCTGTETGTLERQ